MEKNTEPSNGPHRYIRLIFWQRCKANSVDKGQSFQQIMLEWVDINMQKEKKECRYRPYISIKIDSKCIVELNAKHNTIKVLNENVEENLWYFGNEFLDRTPKHNP